MSLPKRYRTLIFSEKRSESLKKTPVEVPVHNGRPDTEAEEKVFLEPLTNKEMPNAKHVRKVFAILEKSDDWQILVPFLIGLQSSGINLGPRWMQLLVRRLGKTGKINVLLEVARQGYRTGLSMGQILIAREVFLACRTKAHNAGFKGEEVEKSLRQAKQAALLLHDAQHAPPESGPDPKRCPEIAGILLELSTARALDGYRGKDQDGDVRLYARTVRANWDMVDFTVPSEKMEAHLKLWEFVILRHGLKLALDVSEIKSDRLLRKDLAEKKEQLGTTIEELITSLKARGGFGLPPYLSNLLNPN
jgi:hypothetical protein